MSLDCELIYWTKACSGLSGNHALWVSSMPKTVIWYNILVSILLSNAIVNTILTSAQMEQNKCPLPKQLLSAQSCSSVPEQPWSTLEEMVKWKWFGLEWLPVHTLKWLSFKLTMPRWSHVYSGGWIQPSSVDVSGTHGKQNSKVVSKILTLCPHIIHSLPLGHGWVWIWLISLPWLGYIIWHRWRDFSRCN